MQAKRIDELSAEEVSKIERGNEELRERLHLPKWGNVFTYVTDENFSEADEPALREVLMQGGIDAETIVNCKFDDAEKEMFARIIKQFNKLYWEMGLQTWMITNWLGVPVLKPPTDMWIYQELIQMVKPTVIIECGTHAGGSALFMHDMMKLAGLEGAIITIDCDDTKLHEKFTQRLLNDDDKNPLLFLLGLSTDPSILEMLRAMIGPEDTVMVILDSDHSYKNVTAELAAYAPLVSIGSALIIEDTSNTPETLQAVDDWYLEHRKQFKKDVMCEKFMLTFNRDGFYERIA